MTQETAKWVDYAESFARVRAQIRRILAISLKPLDVAEIAVEFKLRFRYLPSLERRLRELVESGDVKRYPKDKRGRSIPKYELIETWKETEASQ